METNEVCDLTESEGPKWSESQNIGMIANHQPSLLVDTSLKQKNNGISQSSKAAVTGSKKIKKQASQSEIEKQISQKSAIDKDSESEDDYEELNDDSSESKTPGREGTYFETTKSMKKHTSLVLVQNIEEIFTKKKMSGPASARKKSGKPGQSSSNGQQRQTMLSKLLFGDTSKQDGNGAGYGPTQDSIVALSERLQQMDSRHRKLRQKIEAKEVEKYLQMLGTTSGDDNARFEKLKKKIDTEFQKALLKDVATVQQKPKKLSEKRHVQDIKEQIRKILNDGLEVNYDLQHKYFSVDVARNELNDIQQRFYEEIVLGQPAESLRTSDSFRYHFYDFSSQEPVRVQNLFWQNDVDEESPYETPFFGRKWSYITSNYVRDSRIREYLSKRERQCKCDCQDGCWNPKTCPCYKFNSKLRLCTYVKEQRTQSFELQAYRFVEGHMKSISSQSDQRTKYIEPHFEVAGEPMQVEETRAIFIQQRAQSSLNGNFTFNECGKDCRCSNPNGIDNCLNRVIASNKKYQWKLCVKKMYRNNDGLSPQLKLNRTLSEQNPKSSLLGGSQQTKEPASAALKPDESCRSYWGLYAMEDILPGAFVCEYLGEVITKKLGDIRGTYYDGLGSSYLFDMNDPAPDETFEQQFNAACDDNFFPFCIDGGLYGNESRFINHSCEPNLRTFNLITECDSQTYHSIGLFAIRKIQAGDELSIDYQWDKNALDVIERDVPCLCNSRLCRGSLMRARKSNARQAELPYDIEKLVKMQDGTTPECSESPDEDDDQDDADHDAEADEQIAAALSVNNNLVDN